MMLSMAPQQQCRENDWCQEGDHGPWLECFMRPGEYRGPVDVQLWAKSRRDHARDPLVIFVVEDDESKLLSIAVVSLDDARDMIVRLAAVLTAAAGGGPDSERVDTRRETESVTA